MIRKLTLLFLVCIGFNTISTAQIRDGVTNTMPRFTDTTCPGTQLTFWATIDARTATAPSDSLKWFIDGIYTGVTLDTFFTTAPVSGDYIYCTLYFTNSFGFPDSVYSDSITVYRSDTIPPRALISIVFGNNPECTSHLITFEVYPVNGGTAPVYQWYVNNVPIVDADSNFFSGLFANGDSIKCLMVSNSTCAPFDTVYSNIIHIIHDSTTQFISIYTRYDTVCSGGLDSFIATASGLGTSFSYQWYINNVAYPGATASSFYTTYLVNGDSLYCVLSSTDSCVTNPTVFSNGIRVTVLPVLHSYATVAMLRGSNPGCIDSPVIFKGSYYNLGASPTYEWYINNVRVKFDTSILDTTFLNGQVVKFIAISNARGCRDNDSVFADSVLMIRDSTPVAPLVSLIGDLLVANNAGLYAWYGPHGIIPGATGQTYHPIDTGHYYAILDSANCPSQISNIIYISLMGVNELSTQKFNMYPNPTTGIVTMNWDGTIVNMKLDIYNILGQGILHQESSNVSQYVTDLSYLPNGTYFMVFTNEQGIKTTRKLTIQK